MAGYAITPLVKKLGIKPGDQVLLVNVPDHFEKLIGTWPTEIQFDTIEKCLEADYIQLFTQEISELDVLFPILKEKLKKGGGLWISWPKGSSKLLKDLNGNDVRRIGLENGLVDVKVCAIDDDWSGLKFMYRRKGRRI